MQTIDTNISIHGKGVDIGDALRIYIKSSLSEQMNKYIAQSGEASVTLSREGSNFRSDIQIHVNRRITVYSHSSSIDARSSFELALEHITKRLRRNKRRLSSHHKDVIETFPASQYILPSLTSTDENHDDSHDYDTHNDDSLAPAIVAEMDQPIETLSVSEAVMRMDISANAAVMFKHAVSGRLNMVYKRTDGLIGWVDPK